MRSRQAAPRQQPPPWLRPRRDWTGSLPQWAIAWALMQRFGRDSEGQYWFFDTPYIAGRIYPGGGIDFWLPLERIAIDVSSGGQPTAVQTVQRLQLQAVATVVTITNDAALRNPRGALERALQGQDAR